MSIVIPIHQLKENDYEAFEKHLVIEETNKQLAKKKQKYPWITIPTIPFVHREQDNVYLPFHWGLDYFGHQSRRPKERCAENKITFKAELRAEQLEIMNETIQLLNQHKSCVMAIYPGGGKCLAKGTLVLLHSGKTMAVEHLQPRMTLVNEQDEPQVIQSICHGREMMYVIGRQSRHSSYSKNTWMNYTVNESHILTLWDSNKCSLMDISLVSYMQLSDHERSSLYGIYKDYDGPQFSLSRKREYYFNHSEYHSVDKSYSFPLSLKDSRNGDESIREILLCGFEIEQVDSQYILFKDPFQLHVDSSKRVMITYPLSIHRLCEMDYYGFTLQGASNRRFLLGNGIISHNTITSLAISRQIGFRTFIIVNKLVLMNQWIESIRYCFGEHVRVQQLTSKNKIQLGCSFYIMNAVNVCKRPVQDYEQLNIGFVIVDECHLIMTKMFSKSLNRLYPRYLLGLSATPFRPDGFDILLDLYFGLQKVVRKLFRRHTVYYYETNIKIEPLRDKNQNILWTSVIDQQVEHEERNQWIVNTCHQYSERNILILTKRVKQMDYLAHEPRKLKNCVATLKDNETSFDKEARILIATFQKVGTGFSHDKLDMLLLACDTEEYFMQYLGRVFRTPFVEPVIIDIIDNHPILKKHFLTRKKIYQGAGGTLLPFKQQSMLSSG